MVFIHMLQYLFTVFEIVLLLLLLFLFISPQLATQDNPIVLHRTPFDSWQSSRWTPSFLAGRPGAPHILSKKGKDNIFRYFAVNQPLSNVETMNSEKPFQEVIYPRGKFFELLERPFDGYFYYSSGGIEMLKLSDTVYSEESLKMLTFPTHKELGQVNFWFGKENVTAYTHYDTSQNLHAMVYGQKTFLLLPPSAYSELNLYPCLHQFYRQVHTNVLDADIAKSLRTKPLEVVLNQGEVLYIPPYWFHCVITMETSISLNVWSNSEAFLTMENIFASSIPFEEEWGRKKLLKALNYFIQLLTAAIVLDNHDSFVHRVYSRYQPLLLHFSAEQLQNWTTGMEQYCLKGPIEHVLDVQSIQHIREGAQELTKQFRRIRPQAVKEINLGNFIEHLSWRILGTNDLLLLPFYLHECF